jgi:hypothetical protein
VCALAKVPFRDRLAPSVNVRLAPWGNLKPD